MNSNYRLGSASTPNRSQLAQILWQTRITRPSTARAGDFSLWLAAILLIIQAITARFGSEDEPPGGKEALRGTRPTHHFFGRPHIT